MWRKLTEENRPNENETVLIYSQNILDIACYKGVMPNGIREWILTDVNIPEENITYWRRVNAPTKRR